MMRTIKNVHHTKYTYHKYSLHCMYINTGIKQVGASTLECLKFSLFLSNKAITVVRIPQPIFLAFFVQAVWKRVFVVLMPFFVFYLLFKRRCDCKWPNFLTIDWIRALQACIPKKPLYCIFVLSCNFNYSNFISFKYGRVPPSFAYIDAAFYLMKSEFLLCNFRNHEQTTKLSGTAITPGYAWRGTSSLWLIKINS